MSSPFVLGRLVWRPASLGMLFLIFSASALSIIDTLSVHGLSFGTMEAEWRLVVLLPAAVAIALGMIASEALHTQLAWSLPRFRNGLFAGKLAAMVIVAAMVAYNMRWSAGGASIMAPLGFGALFFALGGIVADPLSTKLETRGVFAALLLLALRPELLQRAADAQPLIWGTVAAALAADPQPLIVGTVAAALALVLLRHEFSVGRARKRPFVAAMPVGTTTESTTRAYWARSKSSDAEWSRPLWRGEIVEWLRACNYEVFGGTSQGFIRTLLIQFVLIGAFGYYLGTPAMVGYLPAIALTWIGFQLHGRFLYPVSRRMRATLAFFGSLALITLICVFALATLGILHSIGPRPGVDADGTAAGAIPMIFFIFAWAPVGQWGTVGRPLMTDQFGSLRHTIIAFGMMALWIAAAIISHKMTAHLPPLSRVALVLAVGTVTYNAYWFALRWYYDRRDIVFVPS